MQKTKLNSFIIHTNMLKSSSLILVPSRRKKQEQND